MGISAESHEAAGRSAAAHFDAGCIEASLDKGRGHVGGGVRHRLCNVDVVLEVIHLGLLGGPFGLRKST